MTGATAPAHRDNRVRHKNTTIHLRVPLAGRHHLHGRHPEAVQAVANHTQHTHAILVVLLPRSPPSPATDRDTTAGAVSQQRRSRQDPRSRIAQRRPLAHDTHKSSPAPPPPHRLKSELCELSILNALVGPRLCSDDAETEVVIENTAGPCPWLAPPASRPWFDGSRVTTTGAAACVTGAGSASWSSGMLEDARRDAPAWLCAVASSSAIGWEMRRAVQGPKSWALGFARHALQG